MCFVLWIFVCPWNGLVITLLSDLGFYVKSVVLPMPYIQLVVWQDFCNGTLVGVISYIQLTGLWLGFGEYLAYVRDVTRVGPLS